jgi:integrase
VELPGWKRQYGKALSHLKAFAAVPLVAISGKRVYELRDQLKTKYSRSAANSVLKVLRILFDWGLKRELCDVNPAAKVDNIRRPKDAKVVNRRWRDDELEVVLELAPPWLCVAIAIAAYTGMRESDVANADETRRAGIAGRVLSGRASGGGVKGTMGGSGWNTGGSARPI